jgi:hypothetical protein
MSMRGPGGIQDMEGQALMWIIDSARRVVKPRFIYREGEPRERDAPDPSALADLEEALVYYDRVRK